MKCVKSLVLMIFPLLAGFYGERIFALSETHLVIIRHAEGQCDVDFRYHSNPRHANFKSCDLTDKGKTQVQQMAELLIAHGFDNRKIAAVYVSSLPRAKATAEGLAAVGIISQDKIHVDRRLDEIKAGEREGELQTDQMRETWLVGAHEAKAQKGESNEAVRRRVLKWFNDIAAKPPKGHILVITHGIPAMELIEANTHQRQKLACGQVYLMPLNTTNA